MKKLLITDKLDRNSKMPLNYALGLAKYLKLYPMVIHVDQFADLASYEHVFAGLNIKLQDEYFQKIIKANNKRLEEQIRNIDADFKELHFETLGGDPAQEIIEFAKDNEVEMIVLGKETKKGLESLFLGGVVEKVIQKTAKSVIVTDQLEFRPPKKVLVPFDFSKACYHALEKALEFTNANGGEVVLLNVLTLYYDGFVASRVVQEGLTETMAQMISQVKEETNQQFLKVLKEFNQPKNLSYRIEVDERASISETIQEIADSQNSDLIIMGCHKKGKIQRTVLGSVSHNLLKIAKRPVVIVK